MTDVLLLDTPVVLCPTAATRSLKEAARAMGDRRWLAGGSVLVSAASARETALLADTGRISLDRPPDTWVERLVGRSGVEAVPLTYSTSPRACGLRQLSVAVPPTGRWPLPRPSWRANP